MAAEAIRSRKTKSLNAIFLMGMTCLFGGAISLAESRDSLDVKLSKSTEKEMSDLYSKMVDELIKRLEINGKKRETNNVGLKVMTGRELIIIQTLGQSRAKKAVPKLLEMIDFLDPGAVAGGYVLGGGKYGVQSALYPVTAALKNFGLSLDTCIRELNKSEPDSTCESLLFYMTLVLHGEHFVSYAKSKSKSRDQKVAKRWKTIYSWVAPNTRRRSEKEKENKKE